MVYQEPYCSIESPKAIEFLEQFPFIRNKHWQRIWISDAQLIELKVQRMDVEFLQKSIEFYGMLPWFKYSLDQLLLLDERGDVITEVGKSNRSRPKTESVYSASRRIGDANVTRITHALYVYNRGRIPLVVVYKTPKEGTLLDLLARYEEELRMTAKKEIQNV